VVLLIVGVLCIPLALAPTVSGDIRDKSVVVYIPLWKYILTEEVRCIALKPERWPEELVIVPNLPGVFK
jgi:hypothetical protein